MRIPISGSRRTRIQSRFFKAAALACALGFAFGCAKHSTRTASFGSRDDLLTYGVYSAKIQDANGLSSKLSLNQNNTYSRKKFQGACLLVENKGEWKCDHESIEFKLMEVRKRADCNSEDWQIEKPEKTTSRLIRNVTMTSFDMLDQDDTASAAQWVRFAKH